MGVLRIPDDIAIGGLEAEAVRLANQTTRLAREAEELVLRLLRGEPLGAQRHEAGGETQRADAPSAAIPSGSSGSAPYLLR